MAALLIVDDDPDVRDTLYDLFADEYLCHAAPTAEHALEFLRERSYDVVITDISMPGLSGVELLSLVRQQNPQTPVIVISGISDKAYADGLLRMGAFDYILKPFSLDAVEACVALALEVSRERKGQ